MPFSPLTLSKTAFIRFVSIAGMLFAPAFLWGQSSNHELLIAEIKAAYQRIDRENLEVVSGSYLRNPRDGHSQTDYQAYFEHGQLVILSQFLHDYGYFESTEYYVKDGELSLVSRHIEIHSGMDPEDQDKEEVEETVQTTEEAFYFHQGQLINRPQGKKNGNHFSTFTAHIKRFLSSQLEYHPQFPAAQKTSAISDIRKEFLRIEAAELTEKQTKYQDDGQWGRDYIDSEASPDLIEYEHTGYYEEGELVKISSKWKYLVQFGTEEEKREVIFRSGTTDYYIRNGEMFFVYEVSTNEDDRLTTESRYYFHGFAMIQALIKEGFAPLGQKNNSPHPILTKPGEMYEKTWQLEEMMQHIRSRLRS